MGRAGGSGYLLFIVSVYVPMHAHACSCPAAYRSKMYQQRPRRYDDTVGTLWLNLLMIFALLGLFLVNVADLMENLDNDADDDNPRLL